MSFCLEDQKPQLPEPPSPPLGLFLATSGRDLGEQFCTDDFCQEVQARMSGARRVLVSETDQYWEYAKKAMHLACDAKTGRDKQEFLELAATWTQTALQSRSRPLGDVSIA